MNTIVITGCNGLIGKSLIPIFTQQGHRVVGIGRSSGSSANVVNMDLIDGWDESLLPSKADVVIHLAQSELFRDFPDSAIDVFNVNTVSTMQLLDYSRRAGVKKFIYASSGGIYGNSNDEFSEDEPVSMRSDLGFYLSTKFCSELLVQSYGTFFSTDILRFFFVYGKEQREDMLIPRLVKSVKQGLEITLQGEQGIKINPVHVHDAAKAVAACLTLKGNNRINVAGSEVFTLRGICEVIGKQLGKDPVFKIQDVEPKHLVADITRMKEMLAVPQILFREGVKLLIT